jgi:hypothetical protein
MATFMVTKKISQKILNEDLRSVMTIKAFSNVSNMRHIQKKIIQRGKEITFLKDMKSIAFSRKWREKNCIPAPDRTWIRIDTLWLSKIIPDSCNNEIDNITIALLSS